MKKPKAIDLFSGCGGLSLGMEKAGFEVVYANELNEDAAKTYRNNFPNTVVEVGDIRGIDPKDVQRRIRKNSYPILTVHMKH